MKNMWKLECKAKNLSRTRETSIKYIHINEKRTMTYINRMNKLTSG